MTFCSVWEFPELLEAVFVISGPLVVHQPIFKSSGTMTVGLGAESDHDSVILCLGSLGDGWSAKWTPAIGLKAKTASASKAFWGWMWPCPFWPWLSTWGSGGKLAEVDSGLESIVAGSSLATKQGILFLWSKKFGYLALFLVVKRSTVEISNWPNSSSVMDFHSNHPLLATAGLLMKSVRLLLISGRERANGVIPFGQHVTAWWLPIKGVMNQLLPAYLYSVLSIKICTTEEGRKFHTSQSMGMSSRMFMFQVILGPGSLDLQMV